jgi:hypothetical protein
MNGMKDYIFDVIMLIFAFSAAAYAAPSQQPETREKWVVCTDPRPQVCTEEYNPVCAQRDNGIRCIQAPCPSTDPVTYGNACKACSDAKVYAYRPGKCAK